MVETSGNEPPRDRNPLPRIKKADLLVPPDFAIDVKAEIARGAHTSFPGYPSPEDKLRLSDAEYEEWKARGGKTTDLPRGPYIVTDHPRYQRDLGKGIAMTDDGTQNFSDTHFGDSHYPGGYSRDERGVPVCPEDETTLEEGAVDGFGYFNKYGPTHAADPVVLRENPDSDVLEALLIRRLDTGRIALPGGKIDPGENARQAAERELREETGMNVQGLEGEIVHQGINFADPRRTRRAWMETEVIMYLPNEELLARTELKPGGGEEEVIWLPLTEGNVDSMFASHPSYAKLAVLAWSQLTGKAVDKNGKIGTLEPEVE